MQSRSTLSPEVESITVQLAGLDITISVRPSQTASGYSSSAVVSAVVEERSDSPDFSDPNLITVALEERALAAETAAQLAALPPPFLADNAACYLSGARSRWPAQA